MISSVNADMVTVPGMTDQAPPTSVCSATTSFESATWWTGTGT